MMLALGVVPCASQAGGPLPVPCASCGTGGVPFAAPGVAGVITHGNVMTVNQHPSRAVLNWQSFDIAKGNTVQFQQPSSNAIALNRIFQNSPSEIFGKLKANGQIYLINQNGIVFGRSARVDTNSLVASSLDMSDAIFNNLGIAGAINDASEAKAAFAGSGDLGAVAVAPGAELRAAEGGRIVLLAPEVKNGGTVETPGGQAILAAAKDKVYLAAADGDPNLRGLLVEVETGGTVTNNGTVSAPRGNVTLIGYAVNQQGLASATTSVSVNGSVRLLARDHVQVVRNDVKNTRQPTALHGGVLSLGSASRTEVTPVAASTNPDAAKAREEDRNLREAVDSQPQSHSDIELFANQITVKANAEIVARGGDIAIKAQRNTSPGAGETSEARLTVERGSHIDASGLRDATVAMERNLVTVELRGNELRDAPLQKNSALRGKTVTFDLRKGTPLADVSGAVAALRRSLDERLAAGGSVSLDSDNALDVAAGANIDVSGGQVQYLGGFLNTTKLLSGGRIFDISKADAGRVYEGIFGSAKLVHRKWGVTESFHVFSDTAASFEPGYVEGKDAGSLLLAAARLNVHGTLRGGVVSDHFQRSAPSALSGFQRAYNEVPLAGRLTLGRGSLDFDPSVAQNYLLHDVHLSADVTDGAQTRDTAAGAQLEVSPTLFSDGHFGRAEIFANGRITVPRGTQVDVGAFGAFNLGAGEIAIGGTIASAGGRIAMNVVPTVSTSNEATALTLEAGGALLAKGAWINERAALALNDNSGQGALAIDGGAVVLHAIGDIDLQSGSLIDVGGGGQFSPKGGLLKGRGGQIELASDDAIATKLTVAGALHGFAFAKGGQLKLTGGGFAIQNAPLANSNLTLLTPDLFGASGFADVQINATRDGITVAPGTRLDLRQKNRVPSKGFAAAPSGADIASVGEVAYLDSAQRLPTSFSLSYKRRANQPLTTSELSVGTGASLLTDTQSKISLSSDTRLFIDGLISAPAGTITLSVINPRDGNDRGFDASQAITLGAHAALLARAAVRDEANALGLRLGQVLDGGTVRLNAQRGYVLANRGSQIDVSGISTVFDLPDPGQPSQRIATTVQALGGDIELTAAEGMILNGVLGGRDGGSLSLALNPVERETSADLTGLPQFPNSARVIEVGAVSVADLVRGAAVPDASNGRLGLDLDTVRDGGFNALTLSTRAAPVAGARDLIRFDGAQSLTLPQSLTLDTSVLASDGGKVALNAPYVRLGTSNDLFRTTNSATGGAGDLNITAQHIDLIGDTTLQGFGDDVTLNSRGDIRMIGTRVPVSTSTEMLGSLALAGDLQMSAARIYPATLSSFTLVSSGADAQITFRAPHKNETLPLSAGGTLTVNATHIVQDGALFAPFGQISLHGSASLRLDADSLTSATGADLLVPFGQTQFGRQWTYPLAFVTRIIDAMPAKRITLSSANVSVAEGAVVDLRGGGNLLASEHIPGPGGSKDILAANNADGSFAIVPTLASQFSPFDPLESVAFGFAPDTTIELADAPHVKAGTYAVLPARYATLPGAMLLTPVSGTDDIVPGLAGQTVDTLPLVAGRLGSAGGRIADTAWQGYRVETAADVALRGEYRETLASDFFATQTSNNAGGLPNDAGSLSLAAGQTLSLSGRLLATAPAGGRGAEMDVSAEHLAIVNRLSGATDRVEIRAADLNAFGAQSLLLGGKRRVVNGEIVLDVQADDVTVARGADLAVPELLMLAHDSVVLETGAKVTARGAKVARKASFTVTGDSALVIASTASQAKVNHQDQTGANGSVDLRAGAQLTAAGSIALDGSRNTVVNGSLKTDRGSLRLASSRISLGAVDNVNDGLVLSSAKLRALAASEWIFDSRSSIDIYGPLRAEVDNLVLNAAGVVGHDNTGDTVLLSADSIVLSNPSARVDGSASAVSNANGSSLHLDARQITLASGNFAVNGFAALSLLAREQIIGTGTAGVATSGDITLTTSRLTTTSGAALTLSGDHAIFRSAAGDPKLPVSTALGGRIAVSAADIDFGGHVLLSAGEFELASSAAGGLRVRDAAVINLAATREVFGGKQVGVAGGHITLNAAQGDIDIGAGAVLDVSASGDGQGGRLVLNASAGTVDIDGHSVLRGQGTPRSGSFVLDALVLGTGTSFSALNDTLNSAGFTGTRAFRLRSGDVSLAADSAIEAHDVSVTADAGTIELFGRIDAHGVEAGRIAINARDDLILRGSARLDASASGAHQLGGVVTLSTRTGQIDLQATSGAHAVGINVAGTEGETSVSAVAKNNGSVMLRAPRVGASDVAVNAVDTTIVGAARIDLEGYKAYTGTTVGTVMGGALNDADTFMANAAAIKTGLGRDADARFHVVPGIEIDSSSNLTLQTTLDLLSRRYDGEPGVLTLRAHGDLLLNASLTDGIAHQTFIDPSSGEEIAELGERDTVQTGPSWSYRLSAGADLASANLDAVNGSGNLVVASGHQVRTGSGSIVIATGGQLRLSGVGSAVYTVGEKRDAGAYDPILTEGLMRADYLTNGGNLHIDARGGVQGVAGGVLPDWLARIGGDNLQVADHVPTAWAVNVGAFSQGLGALGGGAVTVISEGDLANVTIAIPTTGQPTVNGDGETGVAVDGGGIMDVNVGGSIRSGMFLLGQGTARIHADGDIVKSPSANIATVLELGDGSFDLSARGKVVLESVFNPTMTPVAPTQSVESFGTASAIYFSTYAPRSNVDVSALSGDVVLESRSGGIRAAYGDRNFESGDIMALTMAPASLRAVSLRGDLVLNDSLVLAPAARGQLELLADGDLLTPNVQTRIRLTDTETSLIPSVTQPFENLVGFADALLSDLPGIGHAASPLHLGDLEAARIVARHGDIGSSSGNRLEITLAKQAVIEAGRDIINLSYTGQHVAANDRTVVRAGRDVIFSTLRNPLGVLQINQSRFEFNGAGQFDVLAGRDVDLGTSDGILTTGRLRNPALAEGEGSVTVMAGLATAPDLPAFITRYFEQGQVYDRRLAAFVSAHAAQLDQRTGLTAHAVLDDFRRLPQDTQREFITSVFMKEIKEAGITASKPGKTASDYSRGFAAINTLFPDQHGGGDIISLLSRISTLDGGDINLLAPYGAVNAGAAAVTGLAKAPDQLGIVIQRAGDLNAFTAHDFLVNSSRVFALDGGSILIWSSHGNIDAGRGAKSALSIPPPVVSFDALGNVITAFPPAVAGSGIQAAVSTAGRAPGNVFLFAPSGIVDAGDAGIASAGNLTIAATAVLGADNISVGGVSTGVPSASVAVPVGLAGASAAAGSASNAAANAASDAFKDGGSATKDLASSMVSVISVEFMGFGD